jgi:hypothetical protein
VLQLGLPPTNNNKNLHDGMSIMLFRALILLFVTSNVWALGVSLQSPNGVLIEQLIDGEAVNTLCVYGFLDPNSTDRVNTLNGCGLEEGEGSTLHLSSIKELNEASSSPLSLPRAVDFEQGIDELDEQFVRYTSASQRGGSVIEGNALQIFTGNGENVYAHTFNYESEQAQSYAFPELSNKLNSFSLQVSKVPVEGQESSDIHISPYLIDTSGNFKYWLRTPVQTLDEGYWATGDSLGLPLGLDGFIEMTAHPENANTADGSFIVSYTSVTESGLWLSGLQYDGGSFVDFSGQVSPVDISNSKLVKTHRGLAQFYIEKRDDNELKVAYLRFIEESATPIYTLESTDEFQSLESVHSPDGTLYIGHFEHGSDIFWHSKSTNEINYSIIPNGMNRLEGCNEDRGRIFCVMSDFSNIGEQCENECEEGLFLFELIDGVFVKDRTFSHIMLDQGMLSFSGIYAYGKNRFVLLQTVDRKYRLFNLTLSGTLPNKKINNLNLDLDVSVIPSLTEGTFFLVFMANQSAETIRIKANLNLDSQAGDVDSSDGRDLDSTEEEEEDKEIPFAEMSSSLNQYLLILSLFIMFPVRSKK